jgi:hypothetical protein
MSPISKSVTTAISVIAASSSLMLSKAFLKAALSALDAPVQPTNWATVCFKLLILESFSTASLKRSRPEAVLSPASFAVSPNAYSSGTTSSNA